MKAQVSIFVLIGLLILMIGALLLIFWEVSLSSVSIPSEGTPPFYVQSCLDTALRSVLLEYGAVGGGHEPQLQNISFGHTETYLLFPTVKTMKKTVEKQVKEKVIKCTLEGQDSGGYELSGSPDLSVSFQSETATAHLKQHVTYETNGVQKERSQFRSHVRTRFLQTFEVTKERISDFHGTKKIRSIRNLDKEGYTISYIPVN